MVDRIQRNTDLNNQWPNLDALYTIVIAKTADIFLNILYYEFSHFLDTLPNVADSFNEWATSELKF